MNSLTLIRDLAAKLRNLFCVSELQKRDDGGVVQIKTHNGKVLEKHESFPYGFYAKAKNGKAIVFCQAGNYNDFEILPVIKADDISAPELQEGDVALYTGEGGWIALRDAGGIEINAQEAGNITILGNNGDISIKNEGNQEYSGAAIDLKSKAPIGLNSGLYGTGLQPYLTAETNALAALQTAASAAAAQLVVLDGLSGGTGAITALGAALIAFCKAIQSADTAANTAIAKIIK